MKKENNFFFLIYLKSKNKEKKIGTLIGYTVKKINHAILVYLYPSKGRGMEKKHTNWLLIIYLKMATKLFLVGLYRQILQ